jgi:hypothetical protein
MLVRPLCANCAEAVAWLRQEGIPLLAQYGEFGIVFELPERRAAEFTARFLHST